MIGNISEIEFENDLEEFLDRLPLSRENADILLEAVDCGWDIRKIYDKLLNHFASILSDEEIEKLEKEYKKSFEILDENEADLS